MRVLLPLLVCPLLSGCLGLGYPSFCKTPTIQLEEPDVQAFCVRSGFTQWGSWIPGHMMGYKAVHKLLVSDNAIAPRSDVDFPYFYLGFPNAEGCHWQSLEILLYRRGYQLVSVPAVSWLRFADRSLRPQWVKAENLEDAEKAIKSIEPCSWGRAACSPEVRQFLAREYTWVADSEWAAGPERKERPAATARQGERISKGAGRKQVIPRLTHVTLEQLVNYTCARARTRCRPFPGPFCT